MRLPALSVRQPWASLIVWGLKRIEVRTWTTDYRGALLIHASKTLDQEALRRYPLDHLVVGALVGAVRLVEVEPFTPDLWAKLREDHLDLHPLPRQPSFYAWHLSDPQCFTEPPPWRGDRGLFAVEVPQRLESALDHYS